jgi:hypothetical protein
MLYTRVRGVSGVCLFSIGGIVMADIWELFSRSLLYAHRSYGGSQYKSAVSENLKIESPRAEHQSI